VLWLWIAVGVVVLLLIVVVHLYNRLVSLRNRVENAWAQIEVQLRRRLVNPSAQDDLCFTRTSSIRPSPRSRKGKVNFVPVEHKRVLRLSPKRYAD
jgi:predicted Holliday junction resolvase-like endonuclease